MWCIMAGGLRLRGHDPTAARLTDQGRDAGRGAAAVIFKAVRDGAPYPDHQTTLKAWAEIPPRPIRLAELITTKRELALDKLLAEDSTFYGDLFPHVVEFRGALY